jgi:hypothetical protein
LPISATDAKPQVNAMDEVFGTDRLSGHPLKSSRARQSMHQMLGAAAVETPEWWPGLVAKAKTWPDRRGER